MVDQAVIKAQQFVNSYTVSGIPRVEENGKTSWTVMYALTRILQYELGISTLSDNFGPTTMATLQAKYPVINSATNHINLYRVVQSGLYCKGYDGGDIDGTYNSRVSASVLKAKQNMGVAAVYSVDGVTPKVLKALLNMDAYVVTSGGNEQTRSAQQWLNSRYINRRDFSIIPCDGNFSRDVQKALVYAIQYELGMSDDVATGALGPMTENGLRGHVLTAGSTGTWVNLFSSAMIFNKRPNVAFSSTFTSEISAAVSAFQDFVRLPVTGNGDFPTWASLLVSHGDTSRRGTACDTVTRITDEKALALYNAGYRIVGRYLSNVPGSTLDKTLHEGELALMARYGLSVFPIYQTYGGEASYFNRSQGVADALAALERVKHFGFQSGTRIYFGVDFDALDFQITDNVIPHFTGIRDTFARYGYGYSIGIYGPRNVCSRVGAAGLSSASFVSDMSSGYSGNLGYTMPADWAFDQFVTVTAGTGSGALEIDSDIASGRDTGQNRFDPGSPDVELDVSFDRSMRNALLADIQAYFEGLGVPESGGSGAQAFTVWTTTQSLDQVLNIDWLATRLARQFGIRKAMIQCPLLWELRALRTDDAVADDLVIDHYSGTGLSSSTDSSTGPGQIFAATAIKAQNFCISRSIISGTLLDPQNETHLWQVWQQLHNDDVYNVSTIPLVLIHAASLVNVPLPGLRTSEEDTRLIMARYNGTADSAQGYGNVMLGLYRIYEKYYAPQRAL
jgi:peptidoglycan hydrolase-like protein with peptidoglycan-binding domain